MEAIKYIGIRVPVALGDRLAALARKENNQVSAVARRLLTMAVQQEERRDVPPSKARKRVN